MEKGNFQEIPLTQTSSDSQNTVSPPPPYPVTTNGPAIGLDNQISATTNVSPPPPYPAQPMLNQVAPPYPIQQQPKPQIPGPYPPNIPNMPAPVPTAYPMGICNPIMSQPPPLGHPTTQTVIVHTPSTVTVGPESIYVQCPNCHTAVYTKTETEPSDKAVILCVILCLVGCDLGCCLIPFCVDQLQDVEHRCPRCNCHIAHYKA